MRRLLRAIAWLFAEPDMPREYRAAQRAYWMGGR